jgi:hypothetical protein
LTALTAAAAPPVTVTVIDAFDVPRPIDYVVPGYKDSAAGHFHDLTGSIVTLRLPDGRVALLNCEPYRHWYQQAAPSPGAENACLMPYRGNEISAAISGKKAKLSWVGKEYKPVEETYRLVAVLDPPAK